MTSFPVLYKEFIPADWRVLRGLESVMETAMGLFGETYSLLKYRSIAACYENELSS